MTKKKKDQTKGYFNLIHPRKSPPSKKMTEEEMMKRRQQDHNAITGKKQ